jgi:hypothetical protein
MQSPSDVLVVLWRLRYKLALRDLPEMLRWPRFVGQFGSFAKLGSGSRQAANLVPASAPVPIAAYASSGV